MACLWLLLKWGAGGHPCFVADANNLTFVTYMQLIRKKMVQTAKESIKQQDSNSEIYGKMQAVFIEMDNCPAVSILLRGTSTIFFPFP